MTALILATKSHFSFLGSRIAVFRYGIGGAAARFDETERERVALVVLCAIAALLCLYVVSVNIILGEGVTIGLLERVLRSEEIAFLNVETVFAAQSSAEQLKKYDIVRTMEDVGRVEYVRLGSPSFVEAFQPLP